MPGEKQVIANLRKYLGDLDGQLDAVLESAAAEGEATMKRDAPWTDRTGNARVSLSGGTLLSKARKRAIFSGGMPYSPKLELHWAGRYRIIYPTAERMAQKIVSAVGRLRR